MKKGKKNKKIITMQKKQNFLFSIVMATYNVEPYINDALLSLEIQSLDFEKNIQVIIVNDGSTDDSLKIAMFWQSKYPDNIIVIDQKNSGVSVARNNGINAATGKYINFLDPDDYFDKFVLSFVKLFFQNNPNISIAHIPLMLFEANQGPHILNKIFDKEIEVIDINKSSNKIFAHISSSFFRRDLFDNPQMRFEVGRKYGEDLTLVAKLVENERKFGLVNQGYYNYRVRSSGDSAMDKSRNDSDTYIPNADMIINLIEDCKKDEKIDRWLQTVIMYDLAWKLQKENLTFERDTNFYDIYLGKVFYILQYIDEAVIRSMGHLKWIPKESIIYLKNNGKLPLINDTKGLPMISNKGIEIHNGTKKYYVSNFSTKIYIAKYRKDTDSFNVMGTIDHLIGSNDFEIIATTGEQVFKSKKIKEKIQVSMIGLPIKTVFTYEFNIPIKRLNNSEFLEIKLSFSNYSQVIKVEFAGLLVSIGQSVKSNYIWCGKKLIKFDFKNNYFEIKDNTLNTIKCYETEIARKIYNVKKTPLEELQKLVNLRKLSIDSKISNHIINIFQDRENKADDNAEVFYNYVESIHPEWDNFFVLRKDSPDWSRLEKKGFKLVEYKSSEHETLLVQADNLISSQAGLSTLRPFEKNFGYIRDIYQYDFIFLQHGVTKHDLSNWLRKIEKNIRLLVTVSEYEAESFTDYGYQYSRNEVKNTGFPRFDRYEINFDLSKKTGNILIAPTWRNGIWAEKDDLELKKDKFKNTDFFKFWQKFFILEELKEFSQRGNKILISWHPLLTEVIDTFEIPTYMSIIPSKERYINFLKNSDVLITDFSSIYFDIAYQGKPVIYYHFDKGNINNKEGYFDFETMGFGKICYNDSEVINELNTIISEGFKLKKKYQDRVKNFFTYNDCNNSKRLLGELEKLTNNKLYIQNEIPNFSSNDIENLFIEINRNSLNNKVVNNHILNRLRIYAKKHLRKDSEFYKIASNFYKKMK